MIAANFDYNRLTHKDPKHEKTFVVDWCISSVCNYACSYCPENLHDRAKPFPEIEHALKFCKTIRDTVKDREIFFQITGGEVTLWKDLPILLTALKELNCRVGIITNGSRSMEWWQKNIHMMDHVCVSLHSEFANYDHFFEVASLMAEKTSVHCNVMMLPERFDFCLEAAKKLVKIPDLTVALQPLIVDFKDTLFNYNEKQLNIIHNPFQALGPTTYTKERYNYRGLMALMSEQKEVMALPSHEIIGQRLNRWQNWNCTAGVEQIVVDFVGDVYRGWCVEGGKIGNISDENLNLPTTQIKCQRGFCHCNLDIMCSKELLAQS